MQDYVPLRFDKRCGQNVKVLEEGLVVQRCKSMPDGPRYGYCAAITDRPINTSELFQIELATSYYQYAYLSFGITHHRPEEFPEYAHHIRAGACMLQFDLGGHIWKDGKLLRQFLSRNAVKDLKRGDRLALQVTPERDLHFFINGREAGIAATNVPDNPYGVVDIWGSHCVNLINVSEEEHYYLAACMRVMRERIGLQITVLQGMMISATPGVETTTLLLRLFEEDLSHSLSHEPFNEFAETKSTGLVDQDSVKQSTIVVKQSTTLLGTFSQPRMKWKQQTISDEAIGLLKAMVHAAHDRPNSGADGRNQEQSKCILNKEFLDAVRCKHPSINRLGESISNVTLPTDLLRDAFRSKQRETVPPLMDGTFSVCFTDTSGKPEIQELLPALIAGPAIFFLLFKLTDNLNQKYTVRYTKADAVKSRPYVSSFTVKEMMLRSLASISSLCYYNDQDNGAKKQIRSKVILVGTHKDLATEDQIQEIQQELHETLQGTDYFRENIIEYASLYEPAVTINDCHLEGHDMQTIHKIIQRIAGNPALKISIPFSWLMLSLLLRKLTNSVITYEDCQLIAAQCSITSPTELNEALCFLHTKLGVIRYFGKIPELRGIVICDPQVLTEKITNLISSTFTFPTATPYAVQTFLQEGIFSPCDIEEFTAKSAELLTPTKVIKLLEYFHIIAPFKDERKGIVKFFMPCVLSPVSIDLRDTLADQQIPPLLITFQCGYCPKGIFSDVVAHLFSEHRFGDIQWRLKKDGITRERVTFHVGRDSNIVSITDHLTHIELSLQPLSCLKPIPLEIICNVVRKSIEEGIVTVSKRRQNLCMSAIQFKFGFYCFREACAHSKKHPAICYYNNPRTTECYKTGINQPLTSDHCLWFDRLLEHTGVQKLPLTGETAIQQKTDKFEEEISKAKEQLAMRPRLAQLKTMKTSKGKVEIMKTIAPKWKDFCILMDFDANGNKMMLIEAEQKGSPVECCQEMFRHWLAGNGKPATWGSLLELLEDCEQSYLVKQIKCVFGL